jgi:hypothetical protein
VRSPIAAVATQRSVAVSVVVVIAATLTVHDDNHNLIYFDITQVISKCHCPTTFPRLILFFSSFKSSIEDIIIFGQNKMLLQRVAL